MTARHPRGTCLTIARRSLGLPRRGGSNRRGILEWRGRRQGCPFAPLEGEQCRMIDFELSDEQKSLVQTTREFAARELAPGIQENDLHQQYDPATFGKLASLGLPGVCFPERYGGSGMDYISLALVCEELEYID